MFINYAHRGASEYAPENTMSAFDMALQLGANGIELDLQRTRDGKIVIFHDNKIDNKSNKKGKISDYTYQELLDFDFGSWFDLKYKDEQDDYLEFIAQTLQKGDALPKNMIKSYDKYYKEIQDISERITTAFDIENGPIYYQLLIGNRGIIVNEIAARIGGAYEDIFIPIITGVDFLDFLIKSSLGEKIDISKIENYDIDKNKEFLKVIMLFAKPGLINKMTDINEIVSMNGVLAAGYNYKAGDILGDIQDARLRVGYVVIKGDNKANLDENIDRVFSKLKIYNEHNENILLDLEN